MNFNISHFRKDQYKIAVLSRLSHFLDKNQNDCMFYTNIVIRCEMLLKSYYQNFSLSDLSYFSTRLIKMCLKNNRSDLRARLDNHLISLELTDICIWDCIESLVPTVIGKHKFDHNYI